LCLDLDILALAETHLIGKSIINVPGYIWFGNNRKKLHINAKTGSGGGVVGFLIKEQLMVDFDVTAVDNNCDGILWLRFEHKYARYVFHTCVCYFPPKNSSRQIDVNDYFDHLLSSIYVYQNDGLIFLCGDFNARIGDNNDFIEGIDVIPEREVIDFTSNMYGDKLIQFLIDSSMFVLNGRNTIQNDYTSISTKGCAVVDYCIVSQEFLNIFKDFNVLRATQIVTDVSKTTGLSPSSIPDHSIVSLILDLSSLIPSNLSGNMGNVNYVDSYNSISSSSYDKFDVRQVPEFFIPPHNKVVRGVYWNQLVRPSVRPSGCPAVRPSVGFFLSAQ
jgi:hypothetical protein